MGYSLSQSAIAGQPPLLVFTVCLTAFGLTMVILAYIIGEQDIPNPDVQMDWNTYFSRISSFKLCPLHNDTRSSGRPISGANKSSFGANAVVLNSSHFVDESKSMGAVIQNVVQYASDEKFDDIEYVEISAKVQLRLLGKIHPSSFFLVSGKIKGSLLGFTGKYASLVFNVTLSFIAPLNSSCADENCSSVWEVCLITHIPSDLLYETKNPERCDVRTVTSQDMVPAFFVDVKSSEGDLSTASCLGMGYTPNAKLTEMLSLHDRSIVNLHLMHTSYFMFVMVMTLVCYSLIRGKYRHHHPKNSHSLDKVPLDA